MYLSTKNNSVIAFRKDLTRRSTIFGHRSPNDNLLYNAEAWN